MRKICFAQISGDGWFQYHLKNKNFYIYAYAFKITLFPVVMTFVVNYIAG